MSEKRVMTHEELAFGNYYAIGVHIRRLKYTELPVSIRPATNYFLRKNRVESLIPEEYKGLGLELMETMPNDH